MWHKAKFKDGILTYTRQMLLKPTWQSFWGCLRWKSLILVFSQKNNYLTNLPTKARCDTRIFLCAGPYTYIYICGLRTKIVQFMWMLLTATPPLSMRKVLEQGALSYLKWGENKCYILNPSRKALCARYYER